VDVVMQFPAIFGSRALPRRVALTTEVAVNAIKTIYLFLMIFSFKLTAKSGCSVSISGYRNMKLNLIFCSNILVMSFGLFYIPRPIAYALPLKVKQAKIQNDFEITKEDALKKIINFDFTGRPLYIILQSISEGLPFELRASDQRTQNQRVSLHCIDKPLWQMMQDIVGVLSHENVKGSSNRVKYQWKRGVVLPNGKPSYILVREQAATVAEQAELSRPWRDMVADLTLMRDVALDKKKIDAGRDSESSLIRAGYESGLLGRGLLEQKLAALSDEEFAALLRGERVYVKYAKLASILKQQYDKTLQALRERGDTSTLPPFKPSSEEFVTLLIYTGQNENDPDLPPHLLLQTISGTFTGPPPRGGTVIDRTFYDSQRSNDGFLPEEAMNGKKEEVFDIEPSLKKISSEEKNTDDFSVRIVALAKIAKVNIIQEHFIKRGAFRDGSRVMLKITKGTLPQLVNAYCRAYGYRVERVGDTYRFWRRIWYIDRQNDIPEKVLDHWISYGRSKGEAGGNKSGSHEFDGADYLDLASKFTFGQYASTLQAAVPQATFSFERTQYLALRVVSLLTPQQKLQAMTEDGLPVRLASPQAQQIIASEIGIFDFVRSNSPNLLSSVGDAEFGGFQLFLQKLGDDTNPKNKDLFEALTLQIRLPDGRVVWPTS
jgi:hypothetical protein